ncbi:MAG: ESX secretion-associated protein EspG [Actinophytocola sp.]|uniref:ESX secretion-associated protein EspG n=1 Tax=Actinophytocola sp. TaxID=1872138 RepID=UPI0013273F78|nr:ESX secretion-associated protein EspG [Actinophytocola sp.]MPZ79931.1 ESX secretion-associated protein EspG [Actinophytocola sp.]
MAASGTVVLSALEFDVLWERERLPRKHEALGVPSPGKTHTERAQLVAQALAGLQQRGLADGERAKPELADLLSLLAHPQVCLDSWVWTDRQISSLAVVSGHSALLAAVDGGEVWLIPARDTAIAEAAVSVAGDVLAGPGYSVSVPTDVLKAADKESGGDRREFAAALMRGGVANSDAKTMSDMVAGMGIRGQFCASRMQRDQRMVRADRIVAFHDTAQGRYVYLARPNNHGRLWSTVTPADNQRLAMCLRELLDEV